MHHFVYDHSVHTLLNALYWPTKSAYFVDTDLWNYLNIKSQLSSDASYLWRQTELELIYTSVFMQAIR